MILTDTEKLKKKSEPISSAEEEQEIISKLEEELKYSAKIGNDGIGLAAPQIGIYKQAAIIRINDYANLDLINSKLIEMHEKVISTEGCLSLPGKSIQVERFLNVILENNSFIDSRKKFMAYDLAAICIQHEMDHWSGILMTDRAIVKHMNIGSNMPCHCGSKLKYKHCCQKKKRKDGR